MVDLNNIKISWEDFNTNYLPPEKITNEEDDAFSDEDDHKSDIFDQLSMLNGLGDNVAKTPWGSFKKDDKMAPHNFYELKLIHFYGFSSDDFELPPVKGVPKNSLTTLFKKAKGVAVWKFLDPYCFIVGKARLYSWPELAKSLESFIRDELVRINEMELSIPLTDLNLDSETANVDSENLKNLAQKVIDEFKAHNTADGAWAIVLPNGVVQFAIKSQENYDEQVQTIEELAETIEGSIIIRNGEIC